MNKLTDEEIKTIQELEKAGFGIMLDISIEDLKNRPPLTKEEEQRVKDFAMKIERDLEKRKQERKITEE